MTPPNPPPSKIVCLLAPNLPVQVERERHGSDTHLVIAHPLGSTTVFAASDELAGVEIGQSLHQARQIAPTALVVPADEDEYHARHDSLHATLGQFSPLIETVALGECLIDARGLERRWGDEQPTAEAIRDAAHSASRLTVQVGLAANKFTALQAARSTGPDGIRVVSIGEEARFLAPLPIAALPNLQGELRRRFMLLDLHTLGDLTALHKAAIVRQFGPEFAGLYELARGHDPRPINPDVPPLRITRSAELIHPAVDRRVLLNVAARLTARMSQSLGQRGYHAEALTLVLQSIDGQRLDIGRAVKPPTSDEARLYRLSAQLLGRLRPFAPITTLSLSAYPLRPWHVGAHQMSLVNADMPERQSRLESVIQSLWRRFGEAAVRIAALLGPPLPVKVRVSLSPHGLPARLFLGGAMKAVVAVDDHWREEKRWWDRPIRRDYFRVCLADGSLRNLFQDLTSGEWFLDRAWPIL